MEVSPEQLQAAIDKAVQERMSAFGPMIQGAIREIAATSGAAPSATEVAQQALESLRGKDRPPKKQEFVPCKSPETGATWIADIQEMAVEVPSLTGGQPRFRTEMRVVNLKDYQHPDGVRFNVRDGGLVPDNIDIVEDGDNWDYRHWRYVNYWLNDSRKYVGKPLPAGVSIESQQRAAQLEQDVVSKDARIAELEAKLEATQSGEATPKAKRGG